MVVELEVVEVKAVVEMSAGGGPRAPGCPGLCSDTASSALGRRPTQSGSKVKEGKIGCVDEGKGEKTFAGLTDHPESTSVQKHLTRLFYVSKQFESIFHFFYFIAKTLFFHVDNCINYS